jgi:hypothetical protein
VSAKVSFEDNRTGNKPFASVHRVGKIQNNLAARIFYDRTVYCLRPSSSSGFPFIRRKASAVTAELIRVFCRTVVFLCLMLCESRPLHRAASAVWANYPRFLIRSTLFMAGGNRALFCESVSSLIAYRTPRGMSAARAMQRIGAFMSSFATGAILVCMSWKPVNTGFSSLGRRESGMLPALTFFGSATPPACTPGKPDDRRLGQAACQKT